MVFTYLKDNFRHEQHKGYSQTKCKDNQHSIDIVNFQDDQIIHMRTINILDGVAFGGIWHVIKVAKINKAHFLGQANQSVCIIQVWASFLKKKSCHFHVLMMIFE